MEPVIENYENLVKYRDLNRIFVCTGPLHHHKIIDQLDNIDTSDRRIWCEKPYIIHMDKNRKPELERKIIEGNIFIDYPYIERNLSKQNARELQELYNQSDTVKISIFSKNQYLRQYCEVEDFIPHHLTILRLLSKAQHSYQPIKFIIDKRKNIQTIELESNGNFKKRIIFCLGSKSILQSSIEFIVKGGQDQKKYISDIFNNPVDMNIHMFLNASAEEYQQNCHIRDITKFITN